MQLNSFQFPDRSRIETFSQKQQQIIVNQQTPAIPANQVTGTTGQPFVAISPQSMVVSTNGATDLVGGQIQMAMSQQILQTVAVQPDNTFVAMLSPDRQTWMIQETMRSINSTDMTVRMVKRNQLDGEYMIVGRQTVEVNTLVQPSAALSPSRAQVCRRTSIRMGSECRLVQHNPWRWLWTSRMVSTRVCWLVSKARAVLTTTATLLSRILVLLHLSSISKSLLFRCLVRPSFLRC
jgi:hypothetical protein